MNQPAPSIPHRFRHSSIRKFDGVFRDLVATWPGPVRVNYELYYLSPLTVAARLRDARTAYARYRYPTESFDLEKFLAIADDIVVSHQGDEILVGNAESVNPALVEYIPPAATDAADFTIEYSVDPGKAALAQLGALAARGLLSKPLRLQLTAAYAEWLEANFDVSLVQETPDTYILK